jgi:hypothetical protein
MIAFFNKRRPRPDSSGRGLLLKSGAITSAFQFFEKRLDQSFVELPNGTAISSRTLLIWRTGRQKVIRLSDGRITVRRGCVGGMSSHTRVCQTGRICLIPHDGCLKWLNRYGCAVRRRLRIFNGWCWIWSGNRRHRVAIRCRIRLRVHSGCRDDCR